MSFWNLERLFRSSWTYILEVVIDGESPWAHLEYMEMSVREVTC